MERTEQADYRANGGDRVMTLYETIFTRRAVRSYDMTALDSVALAEIQAFVSTTKQIEGQCVRLEIMWGKSNG